MFTGLVEDVGEVLSADRSAGGLRLGVGTRLAAGLSAGESIAVNGVCLTAVAPAADRFFADVSPATLEVTTLGRLIAGSRVNLERALPANGRFGGHLVLGHVDGVAAITVFTEQGDHHWLTVDVPPELARFLVAKGSLAVDGISLTIARLHESHAGFQIVPHTLAHTHLGTLRAGDLVNVECDIIGKYVVQALGSRT
jgi:riboflavin synthase